MLPILLAADTGAVFQSVGLFRADQALSGFSAGLGNCGPAAGVGCGNVSLQPGSRGRGPARGCIPDRRPECGSSRFPVVR